MSYSYSEQLCEQMSAFLDGELPEKEIELLLRRLEREPQLREKIARYAAIGETMRGDAGQVSRGFVARVATAVAQEDRHQVVIEPVAVPQRLAQRLTQRLEAHQVKFRRPQWLRTVGGLAAGLGIAATVAGVAIVTLQRQQNPGSGTQLAGSQTVVIGDRGLGNSEALSYTVPSPATTRPVVNGTRLTDYVLAHSEYSSPLGRRNVLSAIIAEDPTLIDAAGAANFQAQAQAHARLTLPPKSEDETVAAPAPGTDAAPGQPVDTQVIPQPEMGQSQGEGPEIQP